MPSIRSTLSKPERQDQALTTVPSPAEVRRKCLQIQCHWTAAERTRRLVFKPGGWSLPTVNVTDLRVED
jgi:hypothetical protein